MERISKTILSNMCLIENDKDEVVVILRNKNDRPGLNLPGGHVEINESLEESVIREMKEETGLTIFNPKLVGIKEWPWGDGVRYLAFLYYANKFEGTLKSSDEGEVMFLHREDFNKYPLSLDFDEIINLIDKNK